MRFDVSAAFTLFQLKLQTMSKPVRIRTKACESCQLVSSALYRVIADASGVWKLLCPVCRTRAEAEPFYRYGGTWKADKRH